MRLEPSPPSLLIGPLAYHGMTPERPASVKMLETVKQTIQLEMYPLRLGTRREEGERGGVQEHWEDTGIHQEAKKITSVKNCVKERTSSN